jgi:hypothetical protein
MLRKKVLTSIDLQQRKKIFPPGVNVIKLVSFIDEEEAK